jgi:plasmid stability protein
MATRQKRSTIYLEPELHRAVKLKSAHTNRSISDIVNESLRAALREDEEDLAAFDERASESVISYEALLAKLKADGKI